MNGVTIQVNGVVQGVGFRPTVWQIAHQLGLSGSIWNGANGVTIELWGEEAALQQFQQQLQQNPPPLAIIEQLTRSPLSGNAPDGFTIIPSRAGHITTRVAADAATCPACLEDIRNPNNRRYHYPFTNCTHCGPRLSIIRAIPYDRPNTSMAPFTMCSHCQQEYEDPADRRFHAQPNCCPECGPELWLENPQQQRLQGDPIEQAARLIRAGHIVAIKGIGGIHLACDATNEAAVRTLRQRKRRPTKALAVMAGTLSQVQEYAQVSDGEAEQLQSSAAPIVILERGEKPLAPSIAPLQQSIGIMLPYSPLHHLLMECLQRPMVLTSGNRSGEPQCISNQDARKDLASIADYWLLHDRDIINRVDDSVVRFANHRPRTLRQGRGYAPTNLPLPDGFENAPALLAMGGELKNSFALLRETGVVCSQYIGDLEESATLQAYQQTHTLFQQLFDHHPAAIVVDAHPDYLSSQLGQQQALQQQLPLIKVQHHHAHIASVMFEHQLPLNTSPVLGIALDGLGYGEAGEIWGGEFLLADYQHYRRSGHFAPVAMIGGNRASHEPWRNTLAHLLAAIGLPALLSQYPELELTRYLQQKPLDTLQQMVARNLNTPLASSCGRLMDAVAAAIGLQREQIGFEGEAAIALEALAQNHPNQPGYPFTIETTNRGLQLSWQPLWQAILDDLVEETPAGLIAARFHQGLVEAVSTLADRLCKTHQLETVVLGGGVFQNRILLEGVTNTLHQQGYQVLSSSALPANDQGIAVGQCAVAAASLK